MIELPEIFTLTRQLSPVLPGRTITRCVVNQSPHKFAFFKPDAAVIPERLTGRTVTAVTHNQRHMLQIELDEGCLVFAEMGGRILLHGPEAQTLPKNQLLLELDDGSKLTASIVLWGFIQAAWPGEQRGLMAEKTAPLADELTFERFEDLLRDPSIPPKTSVKYFIISQPGLGGVGNGCLQDILFNAQLQPRRTVQTLSEAERYNLYTAARSTLRQMVELGGRDTERDLFNQPGGYKTILGSHAAGKPCPRCGTAVEKIQFLGGASYFCPGCQH
ncbi:MAG: DNA-formamidopyrimidine glycosylase family protein [Anaerolineaceae bacterium]